jgi:hypothetical protein
MAVETTTAMIRTDYASVAITTPLSPREVSHIHVARPPPTWPESNIATNLRGIQLLDPECITSDFDKLRFEAAAREQLINYSERPASKQLTPNQDMTEATSQTAQPSSSNLISSPYNIPGHYLDMSSPHLTTPSRLLALALTGLKPVTSAYATTIYTQALNFDTVLPVLRDLTAKEEYFWKETSFYVVVFRSQLKEGIDEEYLYQLDAESHREACESGGLLKYWFGKADGDRRNLATCMSMSLF